MQNPSTIVIISENADFSEPLASLAAREFGAICKIVENEDNLENTKIDLAIADRHITKQFPFPIITVLLPIRVRDLFIEIVEKLEQIRNIDIIEIGENLKLSLHNKALSIKNSNIFETLTDKEAQILQALNKAGVNGISREELLRDIWSVEAEINSHSLETHIYRLRKKIRDGLGLELIKAIEGGYKL